MATIVKRHPRRFSWRVIAASALLCLMAAGCSKLDSPTPQTPPNAMPEIDETALLPGLAVLYHEKFYKDVAEMTDNKRALKRWQPGKPITYIDHQFESGHVFGSGRSRAVGVRMTGFIRFAVAGPWEIRALSNDGIRVFVNGATVIHDPLRHSDHLSKPTTFQVDRPGWQPLLIKYFQRKGTAALSLYWKAPGDAEFSAIPAKAYAHLPEQSRYAGQ